MPPQTANLSWLKSRKSLKIYKLIKEGVKVRIQLEFEEGDKRWASFYWKMHFLNFLESTQITFFKANIKKPSRSVITSHQIRILPTFIKVITTLHGNFVLKDKLQIIKQSKLWQF